MPAAPSISPATGNPTNDSFIHTSSSSFVDNAGRTLLLRGVNLSGSSKAPVGRPSYILQDFWEAAENGGESFIGRPLNIDDGSGDVHLARLRGWGYNMIRFPVTWEALEHAGPGKYDYEFMDYTVRVLRKCKAYGFKVYMNPHQDIWSRFSGGSGAPYWTILACGINPREFTATQAAQLHCEHPNATTPDPASFPAMQWSTNYGRLASQTLYTLFFGGRTFAPKAIIDGQNIQDYLQGHFIAAFGQLADRIRDAGDLYDACVIGWDSMNEPYEGFCGYPDLNSTPTDQGSTLKKGSYPSPAQSLRLGMGQAQTVDNWKFGAMGPGRDGTVTIDPQGHIMWADPSTEQEGVHPKWGWKRDPEWQLGTCLWAQHGVWDVQSGFVLRPDYFLFAPEDDIEFVKDFWRPHFEAYAKRIRQAHPEAILFVQPPVFSIPPTIDEEVLRGRCCYSAHYYDGLTLITRHWNWFNADALGMLRGKYRTVLQAVKIGERAIRKSLQEQLGILKSDALVISSKSIPYPTVIGEIGTPFDMDGKRSYGWTDNGKHAGDYSNQQKALDASLNAADGPNALNWTLWTYCADNDHTWGDGWNMEDLSLWSADDLRPRGKDMSSAFGVGDESSAGLLNSHTGTLDTATTTAVASTLAAGRSTLSVSTLPQSVDYKEPVRTWDNAYDFLTDGARAVGAFCRPWPIAVIGAPTDIQFDIAKAEFKLTVLVTPADALKEDDLSLSVSTVGDKVEEKATEIYVPLVHFADAKYLPKPDASNRSSGEQTAKDEEVVSTPDASRNVSTINLSTMLPHEPLSGTVPATVLDILVQVSAGRWEVEGQTLKWWYPVPKASEGDVEYTISIQRNGGVIKTAGALPEEGWLDTLCPAEGCCVM
ncbi:hypothetical protein HWV62_18594 [Athelia sp. TMB]|nr:hypothetical protein HWV62_18594 [Athelia sp. TMB]